MMIRFTSRTRKVRVVSVLLVFLVLACLLTIDLLTIEHASSSPNMQSEDQEPYRILFLNPQAGSTWMLSMYNTTHEELERLTGHPVEMMMDNVTVANVQTPAAQEALKTLMKVQYEGQVDFIVARHNYPELPDILEMLPDVPVIIPSQIVGLGEEPPIVRDNVHLTLVQVSPAKTARIALDSWPRTRKIIVISGAAKLRDLAVDDMGDEFGGVPVEYWFQVPLPELKARVASLPRDNVIVFLDMKQDENGITYSTQDVVRELSKYSRVPIFGIADTYFGDGIVGGYIETSTVVGQRAAKALAKLASGHEIDPITRLEEYGEVRFDWTQMKRWGIPEYRIPAQATMLNLPDGYFDRHPGALHSIVAFSILLFATLLLLLWYLLLRRRVEVSLRENNEMLELRVQERTRELESFVHSVSHDLRAPLRAMDGFSHILLEEYQDEMSGDAQRYLKMIGESSQRMGELINALLSFSRIGQADPSKEVINTRKLVETVGEELETQHEDYEVELTIEELPDCVADPILLKQVFVNLLDNAFKFTRGCSPAEITVGSKIDDERVAYFVKDNGVGFDPEYADQLFGVFQRMHHAEDFEGTGVGLAIVKRIVERHGGEVWAESAVGEGATFYFTLDTLIDGSEAAT